MINNFIGSLLQKPSYMLKKPAGFDFSQWESVSDWSKVVFPDGTKVIITKATGREGRGDYVDPTFASYYSAFKSLPYLRGAYHFFGNPTGASEQAKNFASTLLKNGWTKNDLAILDLEWTPPKNTDLPTGEKLAYQVKVWLDTVEDMLGVKCIIYTNRSFWSYLLDHAGNPPSWMKDYLFWIAWYPNSAYIDSNETLPLSMYPTGVTKDQIIGWQYAANWVIPGINYDGVDVNVFYMDKLQGIPTPPPPVVTPPQSEIITRRQLEITLTTTDPNAKLEIK